MKLFLIVEGKSDKKLFSSLEEWFHSHEIQVKIIIAGSKKELIRDALKHYKLAFYNGADKVLFLPDQNGDPCALYTKQKFQNILHLNNIDIIVLKKELEAWILADGECIRRIIRSDYNPSGITDNIDNPKENLHAKLRRYLKHPVTTNEAIECVSPYFSIERAARYNTSAKRFKNIIENL